VSRFGRLAAGAKSRLRNRRYEFDRAGVQPGAARRSAGDVCTAPDLSLAFFDCNITWSKLVGKHGVTAGAEKEPQ
jgi:hypothetical protein